MQSNQVGKAGESGYIQALDGVERKTLVYGSNTLLCEFRLQGGKTLPMHRHPQEQTGYLVKGHMVLSIAGEQHDIRPGDSWCVAGDVEHGAEIREDSIAIEVFSPVRDDYK